MSEIAKILLAELRPELVKIVQEGIEASQRATKKEYPPIMSLDEVCELTRYSKSAIYQLRWAGKASWLRKVGNKLVASRDELQAWMLAGGHHGRVNKKAE